MRRFFGARALATHYMMRMPCFAKMIHIWLQDKKLVFKYPLKM